MGKTRLAIEAASGLAGAFPDGLVFVDLSPITDPNLVLPTIGHALAVREASDRPLAEQLGSVLRDRTLLLVLDNLDQVVEAAPMVGDLLTAVPGLTVLATSRVVLRLSGEHVFPVSPLTLPAHGEARLSVGATKAGAVQLFLDRASAAQPLFALTEENAEAVVEICRSLEGLPLAIELAAARVAHLPPPALLTRLERRLPVLTGGVRDAPPRQRTMRHAIAWSHDLLPAEEQVLFRRLAVFIGGFTLAAAEVVSRGFGESGSQDGNDGPLPSTPRPLDSSTSVFDGVASLVDKSLLRQEIGLDGEPHYLMLETVREYGLEQLEASGEEATTRDQHAAHFLALAEAAGTILWVRHDPEVVERLEAELPNLRAVLAWFVHTGQSDRLLRMVAAVGFYWHLAGHREGYGWLTQALGAAPMTPTPARVRALTWAGNLGRGVDGAAALQHLERAAADARHLGFRDDEAVALMSLGSVLEDRGEYDAAEVFLTQALALFPRPGELGNALKVTYHLGVVAYGRGEADRARQLWEEALAGARALDDDSFAAWCLGYLGLQAAEQGELRRAASILEECLSSSHAAARQADRGMLLGTLAVLGSADGVPEAAARLLGAAEVAEGVPFVPPEGEPFARAGERLRAALGGSAYEHAVAVGRKQGEEAVDADARAVLDAAKAAPTTPPVFPDPAHGTGLTPRELEVLALLVEGRSNREIAEALFVSPRTVDNHVTNILAKLEAKSRTACVAAARRLGLA